MILDFPGGEAMHQLSTIKSDTMLESDTTAMQLGKYLFDEFMENCCDC